MLNKTRSQGSNQGLRSNKETEPEYVKQIVKTRGEGLADVLTMKRDFEKFCTKVGISL